jgi:hypothetical protein
MNRKEFIESEIKNFPNDPLNYYLLAIEFRKIEEYASFEATMENMLIQFPGYMPTYYLYAEYLFDVNQEQKATQIAQQGIKLALQNQNQKLVKELEQLINLST